MLALWRTATSKCMKSTKTEICGHIIFRQIMQSRSNSASCWVLGSVLMRQRLCQRDACQVPYGCTDPPTVHDRLVGRVRRFRLKGSLLSNPLRDWSSSYSVTELLFCNSSRRTMERTCFSTEATSRLPEAPGLIEVLEGFRVCLWVRALHLDERSFHLEDRSRGRRESSCGSLKCKQFQDSCDHTVHHTEYADSLDGRTVCRTVGRVRGLCARKSQSVSRWCGPTVGQPAGSCSAQFVRWLAFRTVESSNLRMEPSAYLSGGRSEGRL